MTNKLLAREVNIVLAASADAVEKLGAPDKTTVVGNPVRPEVLTADRAAAEGDGTLAAWKKAHRKAFAAACEEIGRNFDESMKCVCEYFDVVYRADGQ